MALRSVGSFTFRYNTLHIIYVHTHCLYAYTLFTGNNMHDAYYFFIYLLYLW